MTFTASFYICLTSTAQPPTGVSNAKLFSSENQ